MPGHCKPTLEPLDTDGSKYGGKLERTFSNMQWRLGMLCSQKLPMHLCSNIVVIMLLFCTINNECTCVSVLYLRNTMPLFGDITCMLVLCRDLKVPIMSKIMFASLLHS